METIFAPASGQGRSGVAVIRVSGAAAKTCLQKIAGCQDIAPRYATLAKLHDPVTQNQIDEALVLFFKGPASFTGEDVAEFHVHGGRAIIVGLLNALAKIEGCRMAAPGEFTKRAFENDKLDLTAAEAVADLIAAETEAQRLQALSQLAGGLASLYRGWTEALAQYLSHQEAEIEFPDEDLPAGISEGLKSSIQKLADDIQAHLNDNHRGERLRDGLRVAIIGAPNAGKSSLLNALAERDVAIVSDIAGTTRDVIEVHLDLAGYPVILADTAGLRASTDQIETEGIRRAKDTAAQADIKIALFDQTAGKRDAETEQLIDDKTIVVMTKADLKKEKEDSGISVSAVTGAGMDHFLKILTKAVSENFGTASGVSLTRERHRLALEEAQVSLLRALKADLPELAAEDLRLALRAIGRITGRVHVEELLDRIFRDFCIGK